MWPLCDASWMARWHGISSPNVQWCHQPRWLAIAITTQDDYYGMRITAVSSQSGLSFGSHISIGYLWLHNLITSCNFTSSIAQQKQYQSDKAPRAIWPVSGGANCLPEIGSKKLLPTIFPEEPPAPVTVELSTLLKLLLLHISPIFQEFPLEVWLLLNDASPPLFPAAILFLRVAIAVANLNPTPALFQAVLRAKKKFPGWELSRKPSAALENAMQLVTLWFAGSCPLRRLRRAWIRFHRLWNVWSPIWGCQYQLGRKLNGRSTCWKHCPTK